MNNIIKELKQSVAEAREENFNEGALRARLKEVIHYNVLDALYNSEFKELIFYGGTCLRVLYDLPRMSEDLDFEGNEKMRGKLILVKITEGKVNSLIGKPC